MARTQFIRGQDIQVTFFAVTNNDLFSYGDEECVASLTITYDDNIEDDRYFNTTIPTITKTSNGGEVRVAVAADYYDNFLAALMGKDPADKDAFAYDSENAKEVGLIANWTNPDADTIDYGLIVVPGIGVPNDLTFDDAQGKAVREFTIRSPIIAEANMPARWDTFNVMAQTATVMGNTGCFYEYGTDGVGDGTTTFTSASANFLSTGHVANVSAGGVLVISAGAGFANSPYEIASVTDANTIVLTATVASGSSQTYYVRAPNATDDDSPVERLSLTEVAIDEFRSRYAVSIIKDREILDMKNDATYTVDDDDLYFTTTPDTERQASSATGSIDVATQKILTDANATFRTNKCKPGDRILITSPANETRYIDYVQSETICHLTVAATNSGSTTYSVNTGLKSVGILYFDPKYSFHGVIFREFVPRAPSGQITFTAGWGYRTFS